MVLDGPDICQLLQKAIDVIGMERRVGEGVTIENECMRVGPSSEPRHPLFLSLIMATNVRSIQQKLFRSESQNSQNTSDPPKPDNPLTISIPKTVTPPPSLPSKAGKPQDSNASPTSNGNAPRPYRDRIRQKLGSDYKTVEQYRLDQDNDRERHWKRWGPYVSDRQWVCHLLPLTPTFCLSSFCLSSFQATVREDYSGDGDAWAHFPHEHARSRTYRWGEDGIAGISDNHQRLCFSLSLWNEKDRMLKERLFGVSGPEGNHGEDVKELYYYLDSTPTHSYMKFLYKYPQKAYPYEDLVRENKYRDREVVEFEILDTDVFDEDRYWDVFVEVSTVLFSGRVGDSNHEISPLVLKGRG